MVKARPSAPNQRTQDAVFGESFCGCWSDMGCSSCLAPPADASGAACRLRRPAPTHSDGGITAPGDRRITERLKAGQTCLLHWPYWGLVGQGGTLSGNVVAGAETHAPPRDPVRTETAAWGRGSRPWPGSSAG